MAGEEAAAEGMDLVPGSTPANQIDTELNKTRDYIAQFFKTVRDAIRSIATGGTGASTAAGARTNLAVPETAVAGLKFTSPGFGRVSFEAPGVAYPTEIASAGSISGKADQSALDAVRSGAMSSDVYNRILGGYYRVTYVAADGTLGWVSSSRRFKKNIKPAVVDPAAVLAMELVTFLYKVEIDTGREGILQHGLIAEQLDELGLDWLVDYGADGIPEGVRYDRIALALLPVLQDLARRVDALERKVSGDASATE